MANLNDKIERKCPGITQDVTKFLQKTPYLNRLLGEFGRFEKSSFSSGTIYVVPRGLERASLLELDSSFSWELAQIGNKYSLRLSLPSWGYLIPSSKSSSQQK